MASFAYEQGPPPPEPVPGSSRAKAVGQTSVALVGIGAVLLAGRAVSVHLPACPLRAATGVPCPGCGMTRLADAVAHGRIGEAAGADVAGVAILAVLLVVAVTYLVRVIIGKGDPPAWMRSPLLVIGIGALVAIHWVTTIVTGGMTAT